MDFIIEERKPTAEELCSLRGAVGWRVHEPRDTQQALDGTLYGVCAAQGDEIIGSARIVGDGRTVFYIQDVIVAPEHQGRGIGRAMMDKVMAFIATRACKGAVVGLMAAHGKERFYEKYGFFTRPNERFGAGMSQFWGISH